MSNKKDSSTTEHVKNTDIGGVIDGGLKTIAAGLQSGIGNVVAGTPFAYLQSIGYTHFILSNLFYIPIIIIGGIVGAGYALNRSIKKQQQKLILEQNYRLAAQKHQQQKLILEQIYRLAASKKKQQQQQRLQPQNTKETKSSKISQETIKSHITSFLNKGVYKLIIRPKL